MYNSLMAKFLTIIALLFSVVSVSAKMRYEEIDFKSSIIKYFHSGSKVKIKLRGLPYNTAQVTVSAVNSAKKPKIFIIGKRSHIPANDGSIEFTIELEDLKPGTYNTKSSEITLTLYSYDDKKLVIDEKAKLFIRPIICSDEGGEVCATVEVECHKGHSKCINGRENVTFKNRCEVKKNEAQILHAGACVSEE